jgi:hypothetical protein
MNTRLIIVILLLASCKGRSPVNTARIHDTGSATIKDTVADTTGGDTGYPTKFVENARLDLPDQVVILTTQYAVVNGVVDVARQHDASTSYFIHIDKKTRKSDTLKNDLDISDCDVCKYIIRDMTDSFHLKPLIIQVVVPAEDIYYTNTFLGYKDGEFGELFSFDDTEEEGTPLHRVGSKLVGSISGRDDVVENLEEYPIEIDTKTFGVKNITPDVQYIGWDSRANQSFLAHRVIDGRVDTSLVAVKEGEEVKVDTLYRKRGKVRVRVRDSVELEIKAETAREKLQHNSAG